jgi:hypothetical protein
VAAGRPAAGGCAEMRRLFWLALGASLGVLIFRRLSRVAEKLTPQGIAASLGDGLSELAYSLRDFADDVRGAMSAHESALRSAAGLDSGSAPDRSDLPAS